MAYSFISVEELKKYCEGNGDSFRWDHDDILEVYACACKEGDKIVGLCVGSVYKEGTLFRVSQWHFGENRHRELWIDRLESDPKSECKGSILLEKVEEKLRMHIVKRRNIYVVSVYEAVAFYEKVGYREIETPDDSDDEDYPSAFTDGACVGVWMCKPLGENLGVETEKIFLPENILGDALNRSSVRLLRRILNFDIDQEIFYFLHEEKFEKFQKNTGRKFLKYTEEEFKSIFRPKYAGFLDALKTIEDCTSQSNCEIDELLPYFKNLTLKDLKETIFGFFSRK